jgi:hypothetical protein
LVRTASSSEVIFTVAETVRLAMSYCAQIDPNTVKESNKSLGSFRSIRL